MKTRPYADLYATVTALLGTSLGDTEEARVNYYVNRRARLAYDATPWWARFLRLGEARTSSDARTIPRDQDGLESINEYLKIWTEAPYLDGTNPGYEAVFNNSAVGASIIGQVKDLEDTGTLIVTGTGSAIIYVGAPTDADVGVPLAGTYVASGTQVNGRDLWEYSGPTPPLGLNLFCYIVLGEVDNAGDITYQWFFTPTYDGDPPTNFPIPYSHQSKAVYDSAGSAPTTPATTINGEILPFEGFEDNGTGSLYVTSVQQAVYWVDYQAELNTTYGDGDGQSPDVPDEWFDYMVFGAVADFLRGDGQVEKSALSSAEAEEILGRQLAKLDQQNGQMNTTRIRTTSNTSTRNI